MHLDASRGICNKSEGGELGKSTIHFQIKKGRKNWKGRSLPFPKIAIIYDYVFLTKIINLNAPSPSVTQIVSFYYL